MSDLATLVASARSRSSPRARDPAALENAKARYLGKAGALTELLKALGKLPPRSVPARALRINVAKGSSKTR